MPTKKQQPHNSTFLAADTEMLAALSLYESESDEERVYATKGRLNTLPETTLVSPKALTDAFKRLKKKDEARFSSMRAPRVSWHEFIVVSVMDMKVDSLHSTPTRPPSLSAVYFIIVISCFTCFGIWE